MAFGLSTIVMAGIVTDFGFDLYAPYAMQEIRDDSNRLKSFVGAGFCMQGYLALWLFSRALRDTPSVDRSIAIQ